MIKPPYAPFSGKGEAGLKGGTAGDLFAQPLSVRASKEFERVKRMISINTGHSFSQAVFRG